MSTYNLGDVITLTFYVEDSAGNPANAGNMTVTVTAPDGDTSTPAVANPETGTYKATVDAASPGYWIARAVATGLNAGAFYKDFTVIAGPPLITAAQVAAKQKVLLPDPDSTEGAALAQAVEQATGLVLAYLRRESIDTLWPPAIEAVRAVAVRVAARLWRNPAEVASESYGEHSQSYADPRIFTGDDKTELRPWRKRRARTPIMLTPTQAGDRP